MPIRIVNATDAPQTEGNYAQAVEVQAATRTLYISGQIPVAADGSCPPAFRDQCRQVWANVAAQLRAAEMGLDHLVKVTIYLADRADADANRAIRLEVLGDRRPALTCIITGIFDPAWKLEIEAVAAA